MQAVAPGTTSTFNFSPIARALLRNPHELYHAVAALWQSVPTSWRATLRNTVPDDNMVVPMLLKSLSWRPPLSLPHFTQPPPLGPSSHSLLSTPPSQRSMQLPPNLPPIRLLLTSIPPSHAAFDVRNATIRLCLLAGSHDLTLAAQMQCVDQALALGLPADIDRVQLYIHAQPRPSQYVHVGIAPATPSLPPTQLQRAVQHLQARLPYVWQLPWDNKWKEVWWRLLLGGLPGAGGHGVCLRGACPCGWSTPSYMTNQQGAVAQTAHVMWQCAPAQAVRALLQHHLPPSTPLLPKHLWLLSPPSPAIHPGVWAVVALAALHSIYGARSYMWALRCRRAESASHSGPRQLQLGDCPGWMCPPAPPARCLLPDVLTHDGQELLCSPPSVPSNLSIPSLAARRAVAETMAAIRDFVCNDVVPKSWVVDHHTNSHHHASAVHADHAFIAVQWHEHPHLVFRMTVPPM